LLTSQNTAFWWDPEADTPSDATQKNFGATGRKVQDILKNPVILALRCIDPSPPEIDRHEADRLRIANEVILQLELSSVVASNDSGGATVRSYRERGSKEQVKRTRAELEAYLERRGKEEERRADYGQATCRPQRALLLNPMLAALAWSESEPVDPI
jgi:hypothetical protein